MNNLHSYFLIFIFSASTILAASCSASNASGSPTNLPETQVVLPSETPMPPELPTALPGKVVLIAADPSSQEAQSMQTLLGELSTASGLVLEVKNSLVVAEITPEWRVAVLLSLDENLAQALTTAPQVQFLVFSSLDLGMAANLSVIRVQPEQIGFLAGYISILAATDWRAAGLFPADEPLGSALEAGFLNGGAYYCGICNPFYAPAVRFPITGRLPRNSDAATWQPVVDALKQNLIYVMYVSPEVGSTDLLVNLAQQGLILVGGQTPPEELRPFWAATVWQDTTAPVRAIFPDLLSGVGGKVIFAEVNVSDVNEAYLSSGRQRLLQETVDKLKNGEINPVSVPLQ
jgi:hypothetical protein